ncbi:hypothetical protein CT0861_06343 [Colletotrichum tofieldiae]|uniref:Uncharacterized protein n=1 Tax=Colletotrichum tofieldiae TaxID=708197 RepID=A0A166YH42_9PEZI|nr:hypothetical protein CT0861_06343 [Colletotrichum tofieldiae]
MSRLMHMHHSWRSSLLPLSRKHGSRLVVVAVSRHKTEILKLERSDTLDDILRTGTTNSVTAAIRNPMDGEAANLAYTYDTVY